MKNVTEILWKYTRGEATVEETNAALSEAKAGILLDEKKNTITEAEQQATVIGELPGEINGYGLLDTGTGSLDKVEVREGCLVNADCGDMAAFCIIGGRTFRVRGSRLEG